jgi:hypothetical protein
MLLYTCVSYKEVVHKCFYCSSSQSIHWYTFMFLNTQSQSTWKVKTYCHSHVWSLFSDNGLFLELHHYCRENTAELWISLHSDPVFDVLGRNSIQRYTNRPYTKKSWSSKVLSDNTDPNNKNEYYKYDADINTNMTRYKHQYDQI